MGVPLRQHDALKREIPNPQEWKIISNVEAGALWDLDDLTAQDVSELGTFVYRCQRCDRLHIYWHGLDTFPPTIYRPEHT